MKKISMILLISLVWAVSAQAAISDPGQITGLYLRLEADSIGLANGAAVTSWTDSVHSYAFTGTATYDAYYANGHAAVRFNGVSDLLANKALTAAPSTANLTLFIMGNFTTTGNDAVSDFLVSGQYPDATTANRLRILKANTDGLLDARAGAGGTMVNIADAGTKRHVFTLVSGRTGNAVDFLMDGTVLASNNSGTGAVALQALGLGAYLRTPDQFADCSIAEVLLYDHALTSEQVTDVTAYLQGKYADMTVSQANGVSGVDATLAWNALAKPGDLSQVHPNLLKQYVYLTKDRNESADPNLYYHGQGALLSGLASQYTANNLHYSGSYEAAVVFVMQNYDYTPTAGVSTLASVDPNNIMGPVLNFTTITTLPIITLQPQAVLVDAGNPVEFTIGVDSTTTAAFKWYQSTDNTDATPDDDILRSTSQTFHISSAAPSDEGYYYCVVNNDSQIPVNSNVVGLKLKRFMAWYQFENNGLDSVGTNHGTATPSMSYAQGVVTADGQAYAAEPNGFNYFALTADSYPKAGFGNGLTHFTYACWVKLNGSTDGGAIIGCLNEGTNSGLTFSVNSEGNSIRCFIRQDGGTAYTISVSGLPITNNEWHQVVVTGNGSQMVAYFDGAARGSTANSLSNFADWQNPVYLLARNNRGSVDLGFRGKADDLRIYNYALSVTEVVDLYYAVSGIPVCLNPLGVNLGFDVAGGGTLGDEPDCKVSLPDFAAFAANWLNCGLYPSSECH